MIYVPGMDQSKEVFPKAGHNIALSRGFHVIAIDGPGQGNSNMQKIAPRASITSVPAPR